MPAVSPPQDVLTPKSQSTRTSPPLLPHISQCPHLVPITRTSSPIPAPHLAMTPSPPKSDVPTQCLHPTQKSTPCRRLVIPPHRRCWQHGRLSKPSAPSPQCTAATRPQQQCRRASSVRLPRCGIHTDTDTVPDFADIDSERASQPWRARSMSVPSLTLTHLPTPGTLGTPGHGGRVRDEGRAAIAEMSKSKSGRTSRSRSRSSSRPTTSNRNHDRSVRLSPDVEIRYFREASPPREMSQ
jgi:hypothetical protein